MPEFSDISKVRLATCDVRLQMLFNTVVKKFDCSILCGFRDCATQVELLNPTDGSEPKTKAKWLESPHNYSPSYATDAAPFPINWEDRERMTYLAGYVKGVADRLAIPLIWGGDWDGDTQVKDNKFDDLVHFEIANWRELVG